MAFPFAIRNAAFTFDQNVSWIKPGADLLPGAMQDAFYCYSWANVSDDRSCVTVAAPDAPIIQFGRVRTASWKSDLPFKPGSGRLYSWIYHNLLNTDAPIWCDVLDTFRFGIVFHNTPFDPGTATAAADGISRPLHAELCRCTSSEKTAGMTAGLLDVCPESVRLFSLRAVGHEEVLVRLEETAGQPTPAYVRFHAKLCSAQRTELLHDGGRDLLTDSHTVGVELQPFELAAVRVRLHSAIA